jgi:hypothetical protein
LAPNNVRRAGTSSRGPPPLGGDGGVRDPLTGWTREDATLADTFSIQQSASNSRRLAARALVWEVVEVVQAALTAEVVGVVA